jgi:dienelactone hydrolase
MAADVSKTAPEADLTGWTSEPFTAAGFTHDVYYKGSGPGVVLIPEMPGVHPGVLALGNYLVDNGFRVAIPSLYGTPGGPARSPMIVPTLLRGCVAKEFAALALNKERPVANYLRALAAGAPLLHPLWVWDSVAAGRMLADLAAYGMPR